MITSAKFLTSVADGGKLPKFGLPEIAVAGKSNVGKSSFINFITNYGKLAKTSGEPGRTRLLNYFEMNRGEFILVDLPGYGFAKAPKEEQAKWGTMIEGYFSNSTELRNVFLLLDVRHEPSSDDKMMLNYMYHYNIPFTVIATKADKLSRVQLMAARQKIANSLALGTENVYVVSSLKKTGKEQIDERICQILGKSIT